MKSRCHNHFWKFSRQLLDDSSAKQVKPELSSDEAAQYFSNTYHSQQSQFTKPFWMSSAHTPTMEFDCGEIQMEEISRAIKKTKSQ